MQYAHQAGAPHALHHTIKQLAVEKGLIVVSSNANATVNFTVDKRQRRIIVSEAVKFNALSDVNVQYKVASPGVTFENNQNFDRPIIEAKSKIALYQDAEKKPDVLFCYVNVRPENMVFPGNSAQKSAIKSPPLANAFSPQASQEAKIENLKKSVNNKSLWKQLTRFLEKLLTPVINSSCIGLHR